jgi:hypothetical protein
MNEEKNDIQNANASTKKEPQTIAKTDKDAHFILTQTRKNKTIKGLKH